MILVLIIIRNDVKILAYLQKGKIALKYSIKDCRKKSVYISAIVIFVMVSLFIMYLVNRLVSDFQADPVLFRNWIDGFGIFGPVIFVGMIVLQVVFAIVPGEPFEIGAGYAFGIVEGILLSVLGFVIGSIIIFLVVRKFGDEVVEVFFSSQKTERLKAMLENKNSRMVIFLLFLIPGTPKDLITYVAALTPISFSDMIFLVSVARLPSLVTSVVAGDALGEERVVAAVVVFVITALISMTGAYIYRKVSDRKLMRTRNHQ